MKKITYKTKNTNLTIHHSYSPHLLAEQNQFGNPPKTKKMKKKINFFLHN